MPQISEVEKQMMRDELRIFRSVRSDYPVKERLKRVPISYGGRLFGQKEDDRLHSSNSLCTLFGKQLVLKIIDELLD